MPSQSDDGLFTTAVIDNIDHNPSSTTATDALHGKGISLSQHPRNYGDVCERREHISVVVNIVTWDMTIRLENSQVYVFCK